MLVFCANFIRNIKQKFIEQFTHHSVKSPRADIFYFRVDGKGGICNFFDGIIRKNYLHTFCLKQRQILFRQRIFWFFQNSYKIFFREIIQLHTNRKSSL